MIYQMEIAGSHNGRMAYDVRTRTGAYAGLVIEKEGWVKLAFDSNGNRASARRFADIPAALEYMHARRERRGFNRA